MYDRIECDLGIKVHGDTLSPMMKEGMMIPCQITESFTSIIDHQENINISILQGKYHRADSNQKLGNIVLENITVASRGVPKIYVTFSMTKKEGLNVLVCETQGNIKKEGYFTIPKFIDPALKKNTVEFRKNDEAFYALSRIKHEAVSFIQSCHHMLKESKLLEDHPNDKIKILLKQLQEELKKQINNLEREIKGEDVLVIKNSMSGLSEKLVELMQLFYQIDIKLPKYKHT